MRRGKLENVVTLRKLKEKRDRGRPGKMILVSLASWNGAISTLEMIVNT